MKRLFVLFLMLGAGFDFVQAENAGVVVDAVPTDNVPAVETPVDLKPTPVTNQVSNKSYWFVETWGLAAYNSSAYQENRGGNGYGKIITRVQPRIGYAFPIWVPGLTIDPYLGGEIVNGGDSEFYFNYLAPALGARIKFLKALDRHEGITSFFKDVEFYLESTSRSIYDSTGPKGGVFGAYAAPTGALNNDLVFGFRNYREGWGEHLWWDSFTRFDHRDTDFQAVGYSGWLLLTNGKLGYNLLVNADDRISQPWNVGPYVRFETFKNFVGQRAYEFEFENRLEYGLGFQVRYNLKAENVSSQWIRGFVEYMNVSYYDKKPADTTTPANNLMIGVELWNR